MPIILRIDDVGRKPSDTPEQGTDYDLSYFLDWREKAGLEGLPVVYGVVPAWVDRKVLLRLVEEFQIPERFAMHGWNHKRGARVTYMQMSNEAAAFDLSCYIPPFNKYEERDLGNWKAAGGVYFFGGFNGEHHNYGERPCLVRGVIHLSAFRPLYGRAAELVDFGTMLPVSRPVVATLHVPWEKDPEHVKRFIDAVREDLVTPEAANIWLGQKA